MFRDKHSYPNAYSITDSKKNMEMTKIYAVYEHYLYSEFLEDKKKINVTTKNLSKNYIENTSDFKWVKKNKTYVEYKYQKKRTQT